MNTKNITVLDMDINMKDYPEFTDSFIIEAEVDTLNDDSDFVYDAVQNFIHQENNMIVKKIQAYKYNELDEVSKQRVESHVYEAPFEYSIEGEDELDFEHWASWDNDTKSEYCDALNLLFAWNGYEISSFIKEK